ncbi:DUF1810 family protein [Gilvimarinus gilvus]|uniref:DUF1810 family protein n=1 Tax=Gilvimarinus gilvus TaxID=3058038 RepID=UPI0034A05CAD
MLGLRLIENTETCLEQKILNTKDIFGRSDYLKFHSSMTLFYLAAVNGPFCRAIYHFFAGQQDHNTLTMRPAL